MAVWWVNVLTAIWQFILGILNQVGYILGVQFLNLNVLWQLLPVYTGWFAVQFITRNKGESFADKFLNGFTLLWVGFELGTYIIENFFTDPYIIIKAIIVAGLFAYALFIMRLTLMGKKMTNYLARIGEISIINIAAMLFIQDLLIIKDFIQGTYLIIAFIIMYFLMDFLIKRLVSYIYVRTKLELPSEEEETPKPPRYEEIIKKPTTTQPIQRPIQPRPTQQRPIQPRPIQPRPTQQRPIQPRPAQPAPVKPTIPRPPTKPKEGEA